MTRFHVKKNSAVTNTHALKQHRPQARGGSKTFKWFNDLHAKIIIALISNFLKSAVKGQITVILPNEETITDYKSDWPSAELTLHTYKAFWKIIFGGQVSFGEAYVNGDISVEDEAAVFQWFLKNENKIEPKTSGTFFSRISNRIKHLLKRNTRRGSRKNIAHHYDLGNDFYKSWLDSSMTYSSALFRSKSDSLYEAQQQKYARICDMLPNDPSCKLLEIGCGWGGFIDYFIKHMDGDITGITISKEQLAFADKRLTNLDYSNQSHVELTDYRDVKDTYDAIVSIEMFEAVGETHWQTFFHTIFSKLRPGGVAIIQVITIANDRFDAYRKKADFIQRYIFPGGMLPSPERFEEDAIHAGFEIDTIVIFGKSYAETLRRWQKQFKTAWPHLTDQGFDNKFKRMWHYYLTYCEAGFDHGTINVAQYCLRKPIQQTALL